MVIFGKERLTAVPPCLCVFALTGCTNGLVRSYLMGPLEQLQQRKHQQQVSEEDE